MEGAAAVVLALRVTVLKGVIDEIAGQLAGKLVVVPSNPVTADPRGNVSRAVTDPRELTASRPWPAPSSGHARFVCLMSGLVSNV